MQEYMNCEQRREKIVEFLVIHRTTTGNTLAQEFNVSLRTITRDVTILSLTMPITTKRGNKGGISMAPEFRMRREYLTEAQESCLRELLDKSDDADHKRILSEIIECFSFMKRQRNTAE